jgi:hypothetical protein
MKLIAKMKIKDKMLMRNIQSRLKRGLELVVESNKWQNGLCPSFPHFQFFNNPCNGASSLYYGTWNHMFHIGTL